MRVQAERQVRVGLGSFSLTSDKTLPPALPVFLGGSFCRSVEFSQDRPLPPGLEFSVLPPPGAGLSLEQGSDGEEKGAGGLPQRLWVFLSTLAPSLEETGFELGEAQAVLFLPIIFFSLAAWISLAWTLASLP